MIQRIQTIWLLATTIVLLGLFVFPYVSYIDLVGLGKKISVFGIYSSVNNEAVKEGSFLLQAIATGLIALFPLFIIFQFRNRKRQIAFIFVEMALIVLLGVWMWATANSTLSAINQSVQAGNIGVGFFILPVAIILLSMAIGGIRKDEKLIKSADRLR